MEIRMIGIRKDAGGHWLEAGVRWISPALKTAIFIRSKASDAKHFIQGWSDLYHVTKTEGFTQVEVQPEMLKMLSIWGKNFNMGFSGTIRDIKSRDHADRILIEFKAGSQAKGRSSSTGTAGALEHLENFGNVVKAVGKTLTKKRKTGLESRAVPTIGELETALWTEFDLRVVFRLHPLTTINWTGTQVRALNDRLENKVTGVRTVSQLREVIREYVRPYRAGFAEGIALDKDEIGIISPRGMIANGNVKLDNVRFKV